MGVISSESDVLDSHREKVKKAYPAYGGDKYIAFYGYFLAVTYINNTFDLITGGVNLSDLTAFADLAAHPFYLCGGSLPQLAGKP